VKSDLAECVSLRNSIAHGGRDVVTKAKVMQFKTFVESFSRKFDEKVSGEVRRIRGTSPW
jgi:hypothetical protein